jgi:hypothetical protein
MISTDLQKCKVKYQRLSDLQMESFNAFVDKYKITDEDKINLVFDYIANGIGEKDHVLSVLQ